MDSHFKHLLSALCCVFFALRSVAAAEDKSPSKDGVQWLGSETSLETTGSADYVFGGKTDLGNETHGQMAESEFLVRQLITHRFFRAFLIRAGVEGEQFAFQHADDAVLPANLHVLNAYLAMDFRFSRKDMIRVQARPGFYSEYAEGRSEDFNYPMAFAYSHIVSRNFQWAGGVSVNQWRNHPLLAGGGFRWQIDDRWKLKMMLPEPQIEYKAREDLHVFVGGDFRGDTFRMSSDFGTQHGNPALNNALVDYQELRVGTGFSWNIRPLIEFNAQAGYVLNRQFDYHDNGILLTSSPVPYISVNFQMLFEVWNSKGKGQSLLELENKALATPDVGGVLPDVPKSLDK